MYDGFERINIGYCQMNIRQGRSYSLFLELLFAWLFGRIFSRFLDIDVGFIGLKTPFTNRFYFARMWKRGKACCSSVLLKNILIGETSFASEGVVEEKDERRKAQSRKDR